MLYSSKTDNIYSKCKVKLSFQLWEKANNELSRAQRGEEPYSGLVPDFLGTTGSPVTL